MIPIVSCSPNYQCDAILVNHMKLCCAKVRGEYVLHFASVFEISSTDKASYPADKPSTPSHSAQQLLEERRGCSVQWSCGEDADLTFRIDSGSNWSDRCSGEKSLSADCRTGAERTLNVPLCLQCILKMCFKQKSDLYTIIKPCLRYPAVYS